MINFKDIDFLAMWMNEEVKKVCSNNYSDVMLDLNRLHENRYCTMIWALRDCGSQIKIEGSKNTYFDYFIEVNENKKMYSITENKDNSYMVKELDIESVK